MRTTDLLFIFVCIILFLTLTAYIIYIEVAKTNAEQKCLDYETRTCICGGFDFLIENELENNS